MLRRKKKTEKPGAVMQVLLIGRMNVHKRRVFLTCFFTLVLGLCGEQVHGQWRVAYYDARYSANWAMDGASETVRDAFEDVGYAIMDADQLKTFMDARIADGAPSVVVLCRDIAPDTVVESNSPDCTLRKYLDAGGKVVFYADVPFWNVAHADGTQTRYKEAGCASILGISGTTYADDWVNGDHGTVAITSEGAEWGLTETWTSSRWVPVDQVDTVLAADNAGYASAWVKHFAPGDTTGGFVRVWDIWMDADTIPNVEDLIRVAEYGLPYNPANVDFNGDYRVDIEDLLMLIEYWGTDDPLYNVAPTVGSDAVVDVQDLKVLMSYWGWELFDPHLIAHWKLDQTEGMFAVDSVGDHDGIVLGNALWHPEAGQVDGALELDGTTFVVADRILSPSDGPFSALAWVKGGAPGQVILSQESGSDWLAIDTESGGLMTAVAPPESRNATGPLVSDAVIADDLWHRIALVWDGSTRSLYVDGTLVAADEQDSLVLCWGHLQIGCGTDKAPGSFFTGLIDELRIYDRAVAP